MTALLFLITTGGFWPGGSWQALAYPDLQACERDRPRVEQDARAHGYAQPRTRCVEIKSRDA